MDFKDTIQLGKEEGEGGKGEIKDITPVKGWHLRWTMRATI